METPREDDKLKRHNELCKGTSRERCDLALLATSCALSRHQRGKRNYMDELPQPKYLMLICSMLRVYKWVSYNTYRLAFSDGSPPGGIVLFWFLNVTVHRIIIFGDDYDRNGAG